MPSKPTNRRHFSRAHIIFWSFGALFLLACQYLALPASGNLEAPRILKSNLVNTGECSLRNDPFHDPPEEVYCACPESQDRVDYFGFDGYPFQITTHNYCNRVVSTDWSLQLLNWTLQLGVVAVAYGVFVGTRRLLTRRHRT